MKPLVSLVNSKWFNNIVIALILVNAAILGAQTYLPVMKEYGEQLYIVEQCILWFFVFEIVLKIVTNGKRFFQKPWNLFDAVIVGMSVLPNYGALSVFRSARVLMVLMVISDTPRLRRTMGVLTHALPGIASIAAILGVILYVFAVLATKFFGGAFPEWFGNLHVSLFSLFQIMTLEGWVGMVEQIMEVFPTAWIFFILFIIISTFTILNLFIAVMVDALNHIHRQEEETEIKLIKQLRSEVAELKELIQKK